MIQQSNVSPKRSAEDIEDPSPSDFAQMSRQERKRHREKRRRGKVNAGFDDLKDLLVQIDPETNDREDINRVDLISRAVVVMKKLHDENGAVKKLLQEQDSDQVTVAIPYLIPKESNQQEYHVGNYQR